MMPEKRQKQSSRVILSIPLTHDLKSDLERRAGRQPVSAYARDLLFPANDNAPRKIRSARYSQKDRHALASVLAKLGAMETSASLLELTRLARLGALPVTPELEATLQQACTDLAAIKTLLTKALGLRER